jgi:hypothetical protein
MASRNGKPTLLREILSAGRDEPVGEGEGDGAREVTVLVGAVDRGGGDALS